MALFFAGSEARSAEETPHLFDWGNHYTSDPKFRPLQYGAAAPRVYCNGVETGDDTRRCLTGKSGWVEILVRDEAGELCLVDDEVKSRTIHGHVVVK